MTVVRHRMSIYFYKVKDPYGCFSNFSPHRIHLQGYDWLTSEHYYQAQKYWGTDHQMLCDQIRQADTPEAAAALGRSTSYPLRRDWDAVKCQVMYDAVWAKFTSHADIRAILLATGDEALIEDSPTDSFWGCGANRQGQNHLGRILMDVRHRLRQADL